MQGVAKGLNADRVIRGIPPHTNESPRGYLRRIAREWFYSDPNVLLQLAQITDGDVDTEDGAGPLARALNIPENEWRQISYTRKSGSGIVIFSGHEISFGELTLAAPRICVKCLIEHGFERSLWELSSFVCCPEHGCQLVNSCPNCGKIIPRRRADVCNCSCGVDIKYSTPSSTDFRLVALSTLIARAAGSITPADVDISVAKFPDEVLQLKLRDLLDLIRFLGRFGMQGPKDSKKRKLSRTALSDSLKIASTAAFLLADWPRNFNELLKGILTEGPHHQQRVSLLSVFGNSYHRLFGRFKGMQFSFLHRAFQRSVLESWNGPIHATQKWLTPDVLAEYGWRTAEKVRQSVRIANLEQLVRDGYIEGFFARATGGSRTVCWIRTHSLERWVQVRSETMGLRKLATFLGLPWKTVFNLANGGLIQGVDGPHKQHLYRKQDAESLLQAFKLDGAPEWNTWDRRKFCVLYEALGTTLSHTSRLASVLRGVLDGDIAPVARTKRYPGLSGYIFKMVDLLARGHTLSVGHDVPYLNASDVARMGLMSREKLLALIRSGFIHSREEVVSGATHVLVPASEVESFCNRFVSTEAMARALDMSTKSLTDRLRDRGVEFLKVPLRRSELKALFVPKAVADSLLCPSHDDAHLRPATGEFADAA